MATSKKRTKRRGSPPPPPLPYSRSDESNLCFFFFLLVTRLPAGRVIQRNKGVSVCLSLQDRALVAMATPKLPVGASFSRGPLVLSDQILT